MSIEGDQRIPQLVSIHGHRKLTGALSMLLGGEVAGQELIKFAWDAAIQILNLWSPIMLAPMPENIAASIFGLLAAAAFYQTEER